MKYHHGLIHHQPYPLADPGGYKHFQRGSYDIPPAYLPGIKYLSFAYKIDTLRFLSFGIIFLKCQSFFCSVNKSKKEGLVQNYLSKTA